MAAKTIGDGLVRWLAGGLVAGGILLGLLVGAYEIGYDRGRESVRTEAAPAGRAPPPPPAPAETAPAGGAGLVAEGERLWSSYGCAGCHSLDGSPGVGPTVKGLAGGGRKLEDGTTVTADEAYLAESITEPDARAVEGYRRGVMSAAVAALDLGAKPADVEALVAFIQAQR